MIQDLGREPSEEEIAEGMNISTHEIRNTMLIARPQKSLDAPVVPGKEGRLMDYIPDTCHPSPSDLTIERMLSETIEQSLALLKEREARIVRFYFGLANMKPKTLDEIGKIMGITRERVRQIKERAIERLRNNSRARDLKSFLN